MQQAAREPTARQPLPWDRSPLGALTAAAPALFRSVCRDELYETLLPLYLSASENLSLESTEGERVDAHSAASEVERQSLTRGAVSRTVNSIPLGEMAPEFAQLQVEFHGLGAQLRRAAVPTRLLVLDRSRVFLAVDPADLDGSIVTSTHPAAISVAVQTFASCWRTAHDLLFPDPNRERQRAVLRLLSDGLTDAQVAERMSVSVRTVARTVERLQADLGASGRFQLALLAQRNGLLD